MWFHLSLITAIVLVVAVIVGKKPIMGVILMKPGSQVWIPVSC
jgi:hypothetical protein